MTGRRGGDHQAVRRALLPGVAGTTCPRCGRQILPGQEVDLDHVDQPVVYGGGGRRILAHRRCNRSAGGQLGNARKAASRNSAWKRAKVMLAEVTLGLEISEHRDRTSVAAAGYGADGAAVVELAAYLDGPDAGVAKVKELQAARVVLAVAIDPHSQAATLLKPLADAGVAVTELKAIDVIVAHGRFLDELKAGRLKVVGSPELDQAARLALARPLGGGSTWLRRGVAGDVAPITAATWAVWALLCLQRIPAAEIF
jgi:hypothetical protein